MIAHRFYRGLCPENSVEGINMVIDSGTLMLETDVRLTKDGIPILIHDKLLDRTTNQKGYVKDWTLDELNATCRLSNGETIPTLVTLLEMIRHLNIKMYIELKVPETLLPTMNAIKLSGLSNRVVISSFHHSVVLKAKDIDCNQKTMVLFEGGFLDPIRIVNETKADEVGLGYESICERMVKTLITAGIPCYAFTINDRCTLSEAIRYGLSGVFTDYIELK